MTKSNNKKKEIKKHNNDEKEKNQNLSQYCILQTDPWQWGKDRSDILQIWAVKIS